MFYSTQILAKKGPLGTIWIASHLDRRLKRHQVFETNISITVDSIINPEAPLALRLSGQLLLGVVKVHQKKVGYLYEDCNDALVKIKLAFKPNDVDLPTAGTVAPHNAITLPDNYNDIDFLEESFSTEPYSAINSDKPAPLQLGKRESFLLADDISLLLGSQISMDGEERFEVSGDEMERHMSLSLDEPELLRREMSAADAGTPGYMGDDTPGSYDADDRLEAPPEGMFGDLAAMQDLDQPDFGDQPETPEQMGDELADLDVLPVPDDMMADLDQLGGAEVPAPAAQRAAGGGQREKKRRAQLDINANAQPATQLDGAAIRALLVNRAPLLRPRRALAEQPLGDTPDLFHVARYNEEAAESALLRPSFSAAMARPLYEVYARRLAVTGAAEHEAPSRRRRQAGADADAAAEDPASAQEQAMPEEAPHAAVQTPAADGAPAEFDEPPMGEEPMQFEDGGQFDAPMDAEGMPDPEDLQHAASPSRSARRLTMNGEQGFSNSPSTTAKSLDSLGELEGDPDEPDIDKTSFTARTKKVASHLKAELSGAAGKKKRRLASGAAAATGKGNVMLDDLVEGHSRVDACRWFFELLVLKTKNYVDLEQPQPYGNISIVARPKLLAM
ncbi:probable double-strand-break repair protein rad21 homolog at N-terminal half [Coccomyxa sp. Obi]|nr:probable double-strand-break repair protein rad21 homolog at N-terminal half [Coccomyxa sp. Obi]